MKIRKLDKRNNGYGDFVYSIRFIRQKEFYKVFDWAWNTWGTTKDLADWILDARNNEFEFQNNHWAWQNDQYHRRIYLRSDAELVLFTLKWA